MLWLFGKHIVHGVIKQPHTKVGNRGPPSPWTGVVLDSNSVTPHSTQQCLLRTRRQGTSHLNCQVFLVKPMASSAVLTATYRLASHCLWTTMTTNHGQSPSMRPEQLSELQIHGATMLGILYMLGDLAGRYVEEDKLAGVVWPSNPRETPSTRSSAARDVQ